MSLSASSPPMFFQLRAFIDLWNKQLSKDQREALISHARSFHPDAPKQLNDVLLICLGGVQDVVDLIAAFHSSFDDDVDVSRLQADLRSIHQRSSYSYRNSLFLWEEVSKKGLDLKLPMFYLVGYKSAQELLQSPGARRGETKFGTVRSMSVSRSVLPLEARDRQGDDSDEDAKTQAGRKRLRVPYTSRISSKALVVFSYDQFIRPSSPCPTSWVWDVLPVLQHMQYARFTNGWMIQDELRRLIHDIDIKCRAESNRKLSVYFRTQAGPMDSTRPRLVEGQALEWGRDRRRLEFPSFRTTPLDHYVRSVLEGILVWMCHQFNCQDLFQVTQNISPAWVKRKRARRDPSEAHPSPTDNNNPTADIPISSVRSVVDFSPLDPTDAASSSRSGDAWEMSRAWVLNRVACMIAHQRCMPCQRLEYSPTELQQLLEECPLSIDPRNFKQGYIDCLHRWSQMIGSRLIEFCRVDVSNS